LPSVLGSMAGLLSVIVWWLLWLIWSLFTHAILYARSLSLSRILHAEMVDEGDGWWPARLHAGTTRGSHSGLLHRWRSTTQLQHHSRHLRQGTRTAL